ncbi:MAG: ABC transporter permease [Bacteroides sp.]|nr:ABC transporter permease [Bacteroides sp.]
MLLKQIRNEWRSNLFIFLELLLVFTVLWYIVDWVVVDGRVYREPMGFDTEHCYNISLAKLTEKSAGYIPDRTLEEETDDLMELIDRLKHRPGVEAVGLSQNCYPYNEGSNGFSFVVDSVTVQVRAVYADVGFFRVFRYGATTEEEFARIERALAAGELVGSSNLLASHPELGLNTAASLQGLEVGSPRREDIHFRIGAVTAPIRWNHFSTTSQWGGAYMAINLTREFFMQNFGDARYVDISLRLTPEADHDFTEKLMQDADRLYQVGNLFLLDVTSLDEYRRSSELEDMNEMKTQMCVLGFLLMNIFLGVVGTFWFRTQHRRKEVALRMAMGSSRRTVFARLITEGLLLLAFASIPAIVIAFNIGWAELVDVEKLPFTAGRFLVGIVLTWLLMAVMIVVGIWYPARKAMKVQPAEALHDE